MSYRTRLLLFTVSFTSATVLLTGIAMALLASPQAAVIWTSLKLNMPWALSGFLMICGATLLATQLFDLQLAQPIQELTAHLQFFKKSNLSAPIPKTNAEELNDLSSSLNEIAEACQKLTASRDLFKTALQTAQDVFILVEVVEVSTEVEFRFLVRDFNPALLKTLGASESSVRDSDLSVWLEADLLRIGRELRSQNGKGSALSVEGSLKAYSGERIPIEMVWTCGTGEDPGKNLVAITGKNLSWKKSLEQELKFKEDLLKESQALSKTGSFRWNIQTGQSLWSEQEFYLLGLSPEKCVPSYDLFRSLVWPEDLPRFDKMIADAQTSTRPFQLDLRMKKSGVHELIWVRFQGQVDYDDYGNPHFMYVTTQDITELRKVEQTLIATKNEALKASQAKSEFLAQMSHEIRTPMNAIMGMAELLKETKLDPDQQHYVTVFGKAGEILMSLINDILDLSKIEAGEVSVENIPFDLRKLLIDVEDMIQPKAQLKNLQCSCEMSPDISPYVMGDPTKLRQVLINLLGNSIKFTHLGYVRLNIVKNTAKKDSLLISVSDSGIGIPEDRQSVIFQKFSQSDNSITRQYGGTGLGLAISKSLVELMGGQIWFKSKPNSGTTFYFTTPYREQIYNSATQKPLSLQTTKLQFIKSPRGSAGRKLRILVADDTEDNRSLFNHFLKNEPFEIIEAENGLEALNKVKSDEFDLVFMDVQMPEMDGYTATDRIRQWEKEQSKEHIPIIALTAHALAEDRQRSFKAGCSDHIAKPFKKDTLLGVIKKYTLQGEA